MSMKLAIAIENKYNKVKQTPMGDLILQLPREDLFKVMAQVSASFQLACTAVDECFDSSCQMNLLRKEMCYLGAVYSFTVIVYMRKLKNNL